MEPAEVWPGIDSALLELGALCSEVNGRGHLKELTEQSHVPTNDLNYSANTGKCHERYLLPCQAWNRPSVSTQPGEISDQNDRWGINCVSLDGENSENDYSVKEPKLGKMSDSKRVVGLGNPNPYLPCVSGVGHENESASVRMNSRYMTGVSIATAGAAGYVCQQSDSCPRAVNSHNLPKYGQSVPSVRHHHHRPYEIPWRKEERIRTAEKEAAMKLMNCIDVCVNYPLKENYSVPHSEKCRRKLVKSRSLENVRIAEDEALQMPGHEVDSMSRRIQLLHVDE